MIQNIMIPTKLVNSIPIAFIPEDISQSFPSRGMLMARVEISGISFVTPLEPDGEGSHFFICPESIVPLMKGESLNDIDLVLLSSSEWPDPDLPNDLIESLSHEGLLPVWNQITVKAKWEWIRWIRSTQNMATRQKRINLACIKLSHGDKRPCCFDTSRCTLPDISKSGRILS